MDAQTAPHPTDQTLHAYGSGQLDDSSAGSVRAHLTGCPDCRRRVAALSSTGSSGRHRDAGAGSPRPAVSSADGLSMLDGAPGASASPPSPGSLPAGLADHPDYEILRELGRGGMGVVYLADNRLMGRKEVLKVVGGHLISKPAVLERFLREIRSAARLHHPNIVTAYAALRLGESLVLTMEYVEGLDLSRMVKARGPLPVANACNYINQAALGLQHAHEHGMVHRDIKPANLILARAGGKANKAIVKVLDFGLAKVTSEGQTDSSLTREGQMLGTPDYIAPEQIRDAQSADIRADIYSLGCTLYYLLSGGPPFNGDKLWDIYQAHFSIDASPLNLVRPDVPAELAALVTKMMAKEPSHRFQEPKEVARALEPFFKKAGDPVTRAPGAEASRLEAAPRPAEVAPAAPDWRSLIVSGEAERPAEPAARPVAPTSRRPPWMWPAIVAASVLGVLGLGGLIYVATDYGRIKIVVDDPDAVIQVDGKDLRIKTPRESISLRAGPHAMTVKYHNGEFATREFVVHRGENEDLRVTFEPTAVATAETRPPAPPSADRPPKPVAVSRPSPPRAPVTLTFRPGVDGYVGLSTLEYDGTGKPRTTDSPFLWVDWPDLKSPEPIQHGSITILRFDDFVGPGARHVPTGSTIVAAKLRVVTGEGVAARGHGARVYRLKKPILFGDVLNTLFKDAEDRFEILATPPTGWIGSPTLKPLITAGPVELDVTDDIRAWASGTGNYGWALVPWPNGMDAWAFLKPDCPVAANRPSLSITYLPPANADLAGSPSAADGPGSAGGSTPTGATNPDPRSSSDSFVNTLGMMMKRIPAGEFQMGSADDDKAAFPNEKPRHRVRIGAFYLGATEVTRGQFRRFVDETGYRTDAEKDGKGASGWNAAAKKFQRNPGLTWRSPGFEQTDEHPVVNVSWNDAVNFADWLARKEGKAYRLPTEAQWEYACRAGSTTPFSFGDGPQGLAIAGNAADRAAKEKYPEWNWVIAARDGTVHTAPVGRYKPNPWGLYDMHGNVWEWCSDAFGDKYYEHSPVDDPQGVASSPTRAERGGGWDNARRAVRSAVRRGIATADRANDLGFRLAVVPPGR